MAISRAVTQKLHRAYFLLLAESNCKNLSDSRLDGCMAGWQLKPKIKLLGLSTFCVTIFFCHPILVAAVVRVVCCTHNFCIYTILPRKTNNRTWLNCRLLLAPFRSSYPYSPLYDIPFFYIFFTLSAYIFMTSSPHIVFTRQILVP